MSLPVRHQLTYWSIAFVVLVAVLWGLGSVILPFILGSALAYFMDPVADRLERLGLNRTAATLVIAFLMAAVFVIIGLLVLPTLIRQTVQLVETAPEIADRLQGFLTTRFPVIMVEGSVVRDTLIAIGEAIKAQGGALAKGVLSSAMSLINAVIFAVVVPVVAFYMLLDWDHMVARVDALLPREHAPVIRDLARDIDRVMAGFLRGQVSVCLILGTFYAITLMLAGLQFGLLVGA
ncbi:MAG: AI-2E family transporter, partial [Rhodobacteraceae bacterium]|nr:AI-2E family transporter [Paracoccaceae bacterium]